MGSPQFTHLPRHVAIIPDGNRRWAAARQLGKAAGYAHGIDPGLALLDLCIELGIEEITSYGFTNDNTKRPVEQRDAFQQACVDVVRAATAREVALLVVGNADSPMFPEALKPFTTRQTFGRGVIRTNLLVNYDWHWDLQHLSEPARTPAGRTRRSLLESLGSAEVSRVDLIIRWGGRCRLSGFLPVQCVYSDFYVVDALWPDFHPDQFYEALRWYETQDITLGG